MFSGALYLSLAICLIGMAWRIGHLLRIGIGPQTGDTGLCKRLGALLGGALEMIFSRRLLTGMGIFIRDILLQIPILKNSPWRWAMHLVVFYGFLTLVLLHALDEPITRALFPDYQSTLNPWFFLRNLLGLMVLTGVLIAALGSRFKKRKPFGSRNLTRPADRLFLAAMALILLSGFGLEATQIVSEPLFDEMVYDYMGEDDEALLQPLRAYWAQVYGVVFAQAAHATTDAALETGAELHEEYCAECHHRPTSAFVSYPLAKALASVAQHTNRLRMDLILYHLHFLFSFAALALAPFTKFWHLLATPLNLMMRAARPLAQTTAAARANRRALGLAACTHCGACSLRCSVAPIYRCLQNAYILPSEKVVALKRDPQGRHTPHKEKKRLAEGSFICSDCHRCTQICPAGIALADLWEASKADLRAAGYDEPHHWMACRSAAAWSDTAQAIHASRPHNTRDRSGSLDLIDQPRTFAACVQCTTCTTVCPVVATAEDPTAELDLTPQQIMNLMRLEMIDTALGARMIWKCATCYMCQEHCPQGVRVADVLNELRNMAARKFEDHAEQAGRQGAVVSAGGVTP